MTRESEDEYLNRLSRRIAGRQDDVAMVRELMRRIFSKPARPQPPPSD